MKVKVHARVDDATYQHLYQKGFRAGRRYSNGMWKRLVGDWSNELEEAWDTVEELESRWLGRLILAALFGELAVIFAYFLGVHVG